jgi:cell division cycle protein 20 (cofactor of APC complex)
MHRRQRKQLHAEKADRFIPDREYSITDGNFYNSDRCTEYQKLLHLTVLDNGAQLSRVLSFKAKTQAPPGEYRSSLNVLYSQQIMKKANVIKIKKKDSADEYHLNLLSWSSNNILAIAFSQWIYLWDAAAGTKKELISVERESNDDISSVSWSMESTRR